MGILIQNAGAEKACLLMEQGGEMHLEILMQVDGSLLLPNQAISVDQCKDLSVAVVRYVARNLNKVTLDDARLDDRFSDDAYIAWQRPKSILCLPYIDRESCR